MRDAALQLEGIGKRYHRRTSLRAMLTELAGLEEGPDAFWALRDVNLSVARGECVGIVGHNGAGKSTLLKILSRITPPTTGRYRQAGRLGSLIEVGAGFHPELTGRENVYLAGAIHGMRRREVAEKFDAIVEFAGLREFLDMPVKRYSSGMFVRLGFSVAVHTQPDVLLVDEVLAVGDRSFQMRCHQRFRELLKSGCALILVSHNLGIISRQCSRVVLLDHGRLAAQGDPGEVLDAYRAQEPERHAAKADATHEHLRIEGLEVLDESGASLKAADTGQPVTLRMPYRAKAPVRNVVFNIVVWDKDGLQVTGFRFDVPGGCSVDLPQGPGSIDLKIEALNLLPGNYAIGARVLDGLSHAVLCSRESIGAVQIRGAQLFHGSCYLPHRWGAIRAREDR